MTAVELNEAIYTKRLELCRLAAEQARRYDDEREQRILNVEVHELKAQLFEAVRRETEEA